MSQEKKKITLEELTQEVMILDRVTNALNTAIVALYYIVGVKGDEMDKVKAEDYVKYVQENIHPIVNKADEIASSIAKKASKEAEEAVKEKK